MSPPEAVTIHCTRCGGSFAFVPAAGNARCPYCGHDQPVPAEVLDGLRRYAGDVGQALAHADRAYASAANWQRWATQSKRAAPRMKAVLIASTALAVLVTAGLAFSQALGVSPQVVSMVLTPLLILPGPVWVGYLLWEYRGGRQRARRAQAVGVSVACPQCGAQAELAAGASGQRSTYCGAALVPSRSAMQVGIAAAELEQRRAELEVLKQERLVIAGYARYDMTAYVPYIVGGSLVPTIGGVTVYFSIQMLRGTEPFTPDILPLWGVLFVILAWLAWVWLRRRARRAHFAEAIADLGRQFSANQLTAVSQVVDWLNRYWPVRYESESLSQGTDFVAASFFVLGYPALLNADLAPSGEREPHLHVLIATYRPRAPPTGTALSNAEAGLSRCRTLGFEPVVSAAGLLAAANAKTMAKIKRDPASLRQIATVLTTMVETERAAGAVPGVGAG
ncbi:MAG TPA: hypothetical protein VMI54_19220 [Polyangiaceae bacterium]|nr:hypothetical protein [Polyangiaceae bacterium]